MKSKEMRNVPELRFPEFKNEPEWEEKKISDVCNKPYSGGTPASTNREFYGGSIPFIRSAEINKEKTELFLTDEGLKNSSAKLVKKGDVLVALYGANSGDVAISKIDGAINQAILCLNSKDSNSFLFQYLTLKKDWIVAKYIQGGQGNLSGEIVKSIQLDLPKPKEQQKIADCLSSIDNLITAQSKKVEALKEHKKGLMQQLFPQDGEEVPKLRFPEFKNASKWEEKTLKELAENLDNKRVPITSNVRSKGNIPYYGASGIVDFVNDYIFDEELLCISEDGANLVARTYPIAFSISGKTWVNNHAHVLKFENKYTQIIVENYLNSIKLDDFLTGMAQPKLNKAMLDIIPIPISSEPKEQQKIANFLSSVDELITSSTKKVEALKEHKKALMQQLFPSKEVE